MFSGFASIIRSAAFAAAVAGGLDGLGPTIQNNPADAPRYLNRGEKRRWGKSGKATAEENARNAVRNRRKRARGWDQVQIELNSLTNYERHQWVKAGRPRNITQFKGIRERRVAGAA